MPRPRIPGQCQGPDLFRRALHRQRGRVGFRQCDLHRNAPARDPNYTYKDAIILLSDGLNIQNRYGNSASQIDARQKILCDNAKAAGITIYTVHVNTGSPPDPTPAVLQYCASSPENFFLVTAASQTVAAFKSIGASPSKLRVAR